jgi:alkylglycerol monooxygenase
MTSVYGILAAAFFIFLEYLYYHLKKNESSIHYSKFLSNLSIGICERLVYLFMVPIFIQLFNYIYQHFRLFTISDRWYVWIILLMFTDLVWYWYHRLGHRINLLWAAHIVHHQSEDFNFTVAARITIFQAYVRTLFWCILPLVGFSVNMIMGILLFHAAYSFFTHTRLGKNLSFLEHIFITPSLHSVHHACNRKYIDKNYGDVFVFWDKFFGTFQKEDEQPVFGLTQPFESHSFLWQHFHYYLELYYFSKTKTTFYEKIAVFFSTPEHMDQSIRPLLERKLLKRKNKNLEQPFKRYLNFQLAIAFGLLIYLTAFFNSTSPLLKKEIFLFIFLTLINIGAIMEKKNYLFRLEILRLWQFSLFVSVYFSHPILFLLFSLFLIASLILLPLKKWYYETVLKTTWK